jgi:hypothetical protein
MRIKLAVIFVCVFATVSVATISGQARSGNPIKGIWRIVASGPADHVVDRKAIGMSGMVIFGDGYWMYGTESGDSPRPALPAGGAASATAEQLRAAWGPMDVQGGPYELKGNELHLRHIIAKGVGAYNATVPLVVSFKVDASGKTGTITQVRGAQGPFQNPVTWRIERLE